MLSLTRKTEYALIAACHLVPRRDEVVSARDIADTYSVPLPLLMNVLKTLCQNGFVRSIRGSRGGYTLNLEPDQITLASLIEAIEGPLRLVRCVSVSDEDPCELEPYCTIRTPVLKIHEKLRQFLETVTLADVASDNGNLEPLLHTIGSECNS